MAVNTETMRRYLLEKVKPFVDRLGCEFGEMNLLYLLAGVWFELREIKEAIQFGYTRFDILPVSLNTTAVKILQREINGKPRKVSIWVDSATGGPTPTIRISKGAGGTSGGGFRINAGQLNDIGEVAPDVELWGISTTAINAYVIERV